MANKSSSSAVASIPLPSADLINYRFDQNDLQFEKLNKKLDDMTTNFVTQAYVAKLKADADEKHQNLQKQLDDIRSSAKWWVGTIIAAAGIVVASFEIFK